MKDDARPFVSWIYDNECSDYISTNLRYGLKIWKLKFFKQLSIWTKLDDQRT